MKQVMSMELRIRIADPAGNRTIFVYDQVPAKKRAQYAGRLLEKKELDGEQVGFIVPAKKDGVARLEMMGGEFCGNAARSFAYLLREERGLLESEIPIEISGTEETLLVKVEDGKAYAKMPLPEEFTTIELPGKGVFPVVREPGIDHVIAEGRKPNEELTKKLQSLVLEEFKSDCVGVMFLNEDQLIPAVYVRATDSLFWERSCGSGSLACGLFRSRGREDGTYSNVYRQPGGEIETVITLYNKEVKSCQIGGLVKLEPAITVNI